MDMHKHIHTSAFSEKYKRKRIIIISVDILFIFFLLFFGIGSFDFILTAFEIPFGIFGALGFDSVLAVRTHTEKCYTAFFVCVSQLKVLRSVLMPNGIHRIPMHGNADQKVKNEAYLYNPHVSNALYVSGVSVCEWMPCILYVQYFCSC